MHADQILVIEDGKIIEKGKHEELLRLKGKYSELWRGYILAENPNILSKDPDENETIQPQYEVTSSTAAPIQLPKVDVTGDLEQPVIRQQLINTAPLNIKFAPLAARRTDLFHPHTYPKAPTSMSTPKITYFQSLAKENIAPIKPNDTCTEGAKVLSLQKPAKHDSTLKPEAKEFIPASIATLPLYPNNISAVSTAIQFTPDVQSRVPPPGVHCSLDENKKQNFAKHDVSINTVEGGGSETLEQKHRRRRHRRRSRSSRSSSGNDQPSTATESVIKQSIRTNGYVSVFHLAEPESADPCNGQYLQPTRNGSFSTSDTIGQVDLSSVRDPNTAALPHVFGPNPSTGLNETAPNMPFMMKRNLVSRDPRGGSAQRWKLQGKPGNTANGYGVTTSNAGTNPKTVIGFGIQNVHTGAGDHRVVHAEKNKGAAR